MHRIVKALLIVLIAAALRALAGLPSRFSERPEPFWQLPYFSKDGRFALIPELNEYCHGAPWICHDTYEFHEYGVAGARFFVSLSADSVLYLQRGEWPEPDSCDSATTRAAFMSQYDFIAGTDRTPQMRLELKNKFLDSLDTREIFRLDTGWGETASIAPEASSQTPAYRHYITIRNGNTVVFRDTLSPTVGEAKYLRKSILDTFRRYIVNTDGTLRAIVGHGSRLFYSADGRSAFLRCRYDLNSDVSLIYRRDSIIHVDPRTLAETLQVHPSIYKPGEPQREIRRFLRAR